MSLERSESNSGALLAEGLQQLPTVVAALWLACRAIGSTIVVPLAEELAFRGYLMRRIARADFESIAYREVSWLAVVISSVLFGLMHGRWIAGSLAGLCYAIAARRRN